MEEENNNNNNDESNSNKRYNSTTRKNRKKINWLEPDLARAVAISFWAPGWVVNYFRLVRMDASDIPHVATEPHPEGLRGRNHREISYRCLLALVFRNEGTKIQLCCKNLQVGGHICVTYTIIRTTLLWYYIRTDRLLIFADTINPKRCVRKCGGSFDIDT